jgi:hypothetical protein
MLHWTDDPIFDDATETVAGVTVHGDAWRRLQRLREEYGCRGEVVPVAGITFYAGAQYGRVQLVPEPTNRWDPNAVKVMINGVQVGHVPRGRVVPPGPVCVLAAQRGERHFCWLFVAA